MGLLQGKLFTKGPKRLRDRLNRQRADIDTLLNWNLKGQNPIQVRRTQAGVVISISREGLQRLIAHGGTSGGSLQVRKAYVKTTPGAVSTVACYLDTDNSSTEITVTCRMEGGTALNAAIPSLADGDWFWVVNDSGTWRSVETFFAYEVCS